MLCNVTLLKSNLSPANTRLFTSRSLQKAYFNNLSISGVKFTNCTFNGSRNIKLAGSAPLLNINGYNYAIVYIPSENVTYYSFIDRFNYVNDKTYEMQVTLDYLQTYMFDIRLSNSIVKQRTLNPTEKYTNKYINKYLYYSNRFPYADNQYRTVEKLYYEINGKFVKLLCVSINAQGNEINYCYGNSGIITFVFPIVVTKNEYTIYTIKSGSYDIFTYEQFFKKYQSRIVNMAVVDVPDIGVDDLNDTTKSFTTFNSRYFSVYRDNNANILVWDKIYVDNLTSRHPRNLLTRSPYTYIAIKRAGEQEQILDLLSINSNANDEIINVDIEISISPLYPHDTFIKFNTIDDTIEYVIPALVINITYTVSMWADYYATHSASINDGLATKHSYDIEVMKNKATQGAIQTGLNFVENIGNVAGATAGALVTGNVGGVISSSVGTLTGLAGDITNTAYAYENAKLGLEQEKALLEISWQDIKNSPNKAYNTNLNNNAKLAIKENSTYIAISNPIDSAMVRRYHERFGYEINMPLKDNATLQDIFNSLFDKQIKGSKFDYVELKGCVMFNGSIPQQACRRIEQILEQGIYFWHTNNIGDYEDNY